MIRNVLTDIGGIGLYGVASVLLFFSVFCGAVLLALTQKKPFLTYMGALPLADDTTAPPPRTPHTSPAEDSRHE